MNSLLKKVDSLKDHITKNQELNTLIDELVKEISNNKKRIQNHEQRILIYWMGISSFLSSDNRDDTSPLYDAIKFQQSIMDSLDNKHNKFLYFEYYQQSENEEDPEATLYYPSTEDIVFVLGRTEFYSYWKDIADSLYEMNTLQGDTTYGVLAIWEDNARTYEIQWVFPID